MQSFFWFWGKTGFVQFSPQRILIVLECYLFIYLLVGIFIVAWELYYSALYGLWIVCICKARHCVYSHGKGLRSLRLHTLTHTSETEYITTHDSYITDKQWRGCGACFHSQITHSLCPFFEGLWLWHSH